MANAMKPDPAHLQADLTRFVRARGQRHAEITLQTDLIDGGLLDSLLLVDLILHIEKNFGIRFESEHFNPSNFRSVSAIVDLVLEQLSGARRRPD
jgi:acyl carrier protein